MQARFYAPMYGRFLSPDPARDQHFEETQSWNIYSYVQNDPTMRIDPTGMFGPPSDRQDFIRQCKQMGMSDAQVQSALQDFNKGQLNGLKVGLAVAALPIAWEVGGPLLARMTAALGSAEAPQAIQKGQEVLQEAQQAAPEAKQALQAAARTPEEVGQLIHEANVPGRIQDLGLTNKQAGQLFGWGKENGKEVVKAAGDISLKALSKLGITADKIKALAGAYQKVSEATPKNVSAGMRAQQLTDLAKRMNQ